MVKIGSFNGSRLFYEMYSQNEEYLKKYVYFECFINKKNKNKESSSKNPYMWYAGSCQVNTFKIIIT